MSILEEIEKKLNNYFSEIHVETVIIYYNTGIEYTFKDEKLKKGIRVQIFENNKEKNIYIPVILLDKEYHHRGIGKNIISIIYEISFCHNYKLILVDLVRSFYTSLLMRGGEAINSDTILITDKTNLNNDYYNGSNSRIDVIIKNEKKFENIYEYFNAIKTVVLDGLVDYNDISKYDKKIIDYIYIVTYISKIYRNIPYYEGDVLSDELIKNLKNTQLMNTIFEVSNDIGCMEESNIIKEVIDIVSTSENLNADSIEEKLRKIQVEPIFILEDKFFAKIGL